MSQNQSESLARYKSFKRQSTNKTINKPPGVIMGRTLNETIVSAVIFFIPAGFLNQAVFGLIASLFFFYFCYKIREYYPRSIIQHVMFGLGIYSLGGNEKAFWKKPLEKLGFFKGEKYAPFEYFRNPSQDSINRP